MGVTARASPLLPVRGFRLRAVSAVALQPMATLKRVAPIFPVRDLNASMAHYQRMGFATRAYEGGGYGFATRGRAEIHLGLSEDTGSRQSSAYLFVDDADELSDEWCTAGVYVHEPVDTEWGMHEGAVVDPDGNVVRFGSPIIRARTTDGPSGPATTTKRPDLAS